MTESDKVVVLLSGGLDSSTLLGWCVDKGYQVSPLSLFYGQTHKKELNHASEVCRWYGLENRFKVATLPLGLLSGSSLLGQGPIPEGHYEAESMKSTVVPNRNMIFIALAVGYAQSIGASKVFYAAHSGDHAIYPDCRPEFVSRMQEAVFVSTGEEVSLEAPFLLLSKHMIVSEGTRLRVPLHLTWSCYKGKEFHCGKCGTCVERKEAFELAGVVDPTLYGEV